MLRRAGWGVTPLVLTLCTTCPALSWVANGPPANASALLTRPTQGGADRVGDGYRLGETRIRTQCFTVKNRAGGRRRLCVHWASRTKDAPPAVDRNRNQTPDQVDATIRTYRKVWHVEVNEFGYRAPRPDRGRPAGQGPNRGLDIYLVDVGDDGLDGYCIGDRPGRHAGVERTASRTKGELLRRHHRKHKRAHAYCVLDDDFAPRQYPTGASGRRALHVTVAHEFFHAIQSAYEATKRDRWLREGTAEWMEDEVFDHANANYDFLPASQLLEPGVPLDAFQAVDDAQDFEYGSWIFWRFLSEYYGTRAVIRQVWQAAAPTGGLNRTALEAVRDVVAGRPPDQSRCRVYCSAGAFPQVFSEFSYWVRNYVQSYEEGPGYSAVLKGARSPGDAEFLFSSQSTTTGPRELALDHLTSGEVTAQVDPGSFQEPSVRVTVDLPIETGPGAIVQATFTNGQVAVYPVQTDGSGRGSLELHGISAVDLILSNSDARLDAEPYRYQIEVLP